MLDLAVVILTFNEERHIGRAIDSICDIAREIFVVDSYSTDRTIEIAQAAGAIILKNKFVNQAQQFDWGIANAPITANWVMRLDADEVIEPDLVAEINKRLPTVGSDVVGINLKRKHIFMNRWVRHGGRYPLILLRIWRKGYGRVEMRWMDEHIVVWGGRTVTFEGGFTDHNLNDLSYFTEKHNRYATREAIIILSQKYELFVADENSALGMISAQASVRRFIKNRIYNHLPFWMGPLGYFLFRYVVQLGFLDGRSGLIYHFLQAGWYRFLVNAKVAEFEAQFENCTSREQRVAVLERLTGFQLSK